jgi:hypothetical protein
VRDSEAGFCVDRHACSQGAPSIGCSLSPKVAGVMDRKYKRWLIEQTPPFREDMWAPAGC